MEQNFQTSFIPKKPILEHRELSNRSFGLFTVIAIFFLITVVVISAGLFIYRGALNKSIANKAASLNLAKNGFEPSKITELQALDKRLRASTEILSKHIAITPIFAALQAITMKTVRYTQFTYDLGTEKDSKVRVKMSGIAQGYAAVALQSDLYAKNKNIIDPVFSNLTLDDKGNVLFDLQFSVDPSFVDYKQMLLTQI
ncbi:MAG: hypothetical protein ABIS26_01595 [Candidatus Paceibacterota bacterium]